MNKSTLYIEVPQTSLVNRNWQDHRCQPPRDRGGRHATYMEYNLIMIYEDITNIFLFYKTKKHLFDYTGVKNYYSQRQNPLKIHTSMKHAYSNFFPFLNRITFVHYVKKVLILLSLNILFNRMNFMLDFNCVKNYYSQRQDSFKTRPSREHAYSNFFLFPKMIFFIQYRIKVNIVFSSNNLCNLSNFIFDYNYVKNYYSRRLIPSKFYPSRKHAYSNFFLFFKLIIFVQYIIKIYILFSLNILFNLMNCIYLSHQARHTSHNYFQHFETHDKLNDTFGTLLTLRKITSFNLGTMAQKYGPFTATYNPHQINEELARLNIADNTAPVPTKEQVLKEFSAFYKVRTLISEKLDAAKGEDALAHFYANYTKRSVLINPGKEWETKEIVMSRMAVNTSITIVLPPSPPLFVIVGKSHARNLADVNFEFSDNAKVKYHYARTAHVILADGHPTWFATWAATLHATISNELCSKYPVFTKENYLPVVMLLNPFSWWIGKPELTDYSAAGPPFPKIPWAKTLATYLMKASNTLTECFAGNQVINFGFGFIEMPLFPAVALRSAQQNKIVREINFLNSRENPPCRSWRSCLTDIEAPRCKKVNVSGFAGLYYDPMMYGTGNGEYWTHLSEQGSAAFLCSVWTAWGQGLRDEQALYDYQGVREAIFVPPYLSASYFTECYQLRRKAEADTTNLENLKMADSISKFSINVHSMSLAIKDLSYPNEQSRPNTGRARSSNHDHYDESMDEDDQPSHNRARGRVHDGVHGVHGGKITKKVHRGRGRGRRF